MPFFGVSLTLSSYYDKDEWIVSRRPEGATTQTKD